MPGLTPEQEAKLNDIDSGEGKNLTPAQKAVMLKFGTIDIKAGEKQFGEATVPGPGLVTPKKRELAVDPIKSDEPELKATYK
tara:strand:+ start:20 stop:265 length:246 start_codon:yes stop_codon:yes gene_type:complete